eukprot:3878156-Prymnesium_polylepis.1
MMLTSTPTEPPLADDVPSGSNGDTVTPPIVKKGNHQFFKFLNPEPFVPPQGGAKYKIHVDRNKVVDFRGPSYIMLCQEANCPKPHIYVKATLNEAELKKLCEGAWGRHKGNNKRPGYHFENKTTGIAVAQAATPQEHKGVLAWID